MTSRFRHFDGSQQLRKISKKMGRRMIFLIWKNYDGVRVEEFVDVENAEIRCAEIQRKLDLDDSYGTEILAVINGQKMKMKTIEVTSKVRLDGV